VWPDGFITRDWTRTACQQWNRRTELTCSRPSCRRPLKLEEIDKDLPHYEGDWTCSGCSFEFNRRWDFICTIPDCRRPRRHTFDQRLGDWNCLDCGHFNFAKRRRCQNFTCPSNAWICPRCGNDNFAGRRQCNTRWCRFERPFHKDDPRPKSQRSPDDQREL
jgi:hypothetical protein